jgi:hypothetical protein
MGRNESRLDMSAWLGAATNNAPAAPLDKRRSDQATEMRRDTIFVAQPGLSASPS